MGQYALRRLWQMIPVLLLVSIAVFSIIHLIPGSPAENIAGPNADEAQIAALKEEMGQSTDEIRQIAQTISDHLPPARPMEDDR